MTDYYITFGQGHIHRVNGKTFDADGVAVIKAKDEGTARTRAFELFGSKWFTSYTKDSISMEYYPRGLIHVK